MCNSVKCRKHELQGAKNKALKAKARSTRPDMDQGMAGPALPGLGYDKAFEPLGLTQCGISLVVL